MIVSLKFFSFFWLLINCWFFKNNLSSSFREHRTKETLAIGTQSVDGWEPKKKFEPEKNPIFSQVSLLSGKISRMFLH